MVVFFSVVGSGVGSGVVVGTNSVVGTVGSGVEGVS